MSKFAQPVSDGVSSRIEVSFPYMLSVGDGRDARTWAPISSSWFNPWQTLPVCLSCIGSLVTGCGWEGTLLPCPDWHTWAVGRRHVYPHTPRSPQLLTASLTPCALLSSSGKWGWQPRLTESKEQSLPSDLVFQMGSVASVEGFWEWEQSPGTLSRAQETCVGTATCPTLESSKAEGGSRVGSSHGFRSPTEPLEEARTQEECLWSRLAITRSPCGPQFLPLSPFPAQMPRPPRWAPLLPRRAPQLSGVLGPGPVPACPSAAPSVGIPRAVPAASSKLTRLSSLAWPGVDRIIWIKWLSLVFN